MSDDLTEERERRIAAALSRLARFDPTWAEMFREYVLDGMYKREILDQKTRELCAVSALTIVKVPGPLMDHIKGAIRCGASVAEVTEAILQASVYGGFPGALAALTTLEETCEQLGMPLEPSSGT